MRNLARKHTATLIMAVLMIAFGIAEVATSFTHDFFGLTTTAQVVSTLVGVVLGLCYIAAGALVITLRRPALAAAFILLIVDVLGRLLMMVTGMYPMDSAMQSIGIIVGTVIAAAFAVFVALKRHGLSRQDADAPRIRAAG